jgi:hypothetical protein
MGHNRLVPAAVAALVLAGCGSDSSSQPRTPQSDKPVTHAGPPRSWTLPDFLRLSGIRRSPDGLSYRLAAHPRCTTVTVLRSTAEVQTYVASGDVIATNPDGSAGVKVEPGEPTSCRRLFTRALAHVRQ